MVLKATLSLTVPPHPYKPGPPGIPIREFPGIEQPSNSVEFPREFPGISPVPFAAILNCDFLSIKRDLRHF